MTRQPRGELASASGNAPSSVRRRILLRTGRPVSHGMGVAAVFTALLLAIPLVVALAALSAPFRAGLHFARRAIDGARVRRMLASDRWWEFERDLQAYVELGPSLH